MATTWQRKNTLHNAPSGDIIGLNFFRRGTKMPKGDCNVKANPLWASTGCYVQRNVIGDNHPCSSSFISLAKLRNKSSLILWNIFILKRKTFFNCTNGHKTSIYHLRHLNVKYEKYLLNHPENKTSTKLVNLYLIQRKQSSWILTSQTGGQPYSDTSPYKLSERSLNHPTYQFDPRGRCIKVK